MGKSLHEVEQKIKNLRQQINDILHLTSLNNQSIICINTKTNHDNQQQSHKQHYENIQQQYEINNQQQQQQNNKQSSNRKSSQPNNKLYHNHRKYQQQLQSITKQLQKRQQHHLNYLIVRQIQGQQQSVRRDRLNQYQDKIYDQRRLISDKQVFLQTLYRPKKQRPQTMSADQFQQLRAKQRLQQEKYKLYSLDEEINKLTDYCQKLSKVKINISNLSNNNNSRMNAQNNNITTIKQDTIISSNGNKIKDDKDLQNTKAHSLQVVNLSAFNNINMINNYENQKPQKIIEQAQLNNIIINNNNITQNKQQYSSLSQKLFNNNNPTNNNNNNSRCFSILINKLLAQTIKKQTQQNIKQKFQRIKHLLKRIQQTKSSNQTKRKLLKQIQLENLHMHSHLNKVKSSYKQQSQKIKTI